MREEGFLEAHSGRNKPRERGEIDTPEGLRVTTLLGRNACTKVQVFHREDRENEAKTMAKVKVS